MKWQLSICILLLLAGCSGRPENAGQTPRPLHQSGSHGSSTPLQQQVILDAPVIQQNPELKYGCEVTSLAMLLQHAGIDADKTNLAQRMVTDPDPLEQSDSGDILRWGNPHDGFVGDVSGTNRGYAIYAKPLQNLMQQYLPDRTVNLTGRPFEDLIEQIRKGKPVVVWTTAHYSPPRQWEQWSHDDQQIKATMEEHAVLLVGFDLQHVYVNDPLTGDKARKTPRDPFVEAWKQLGSQALSYS